jgi:hypothetical protein
VSRCVAPAHPPLLFSDQFMPMLHPVLLLFLCLCMSISACLTFVCLKLGVLSFL